jgi:hypothetical protein
MYAIVCPQKTPQVIFPNILDVLFLVLECAFKLRAVYRKSNSRESVAMVPSVALAAHQ